MFYLFYLLLHPAFVRSATARALDPPHGAALPPRVRVYCEALRRTRFCSVACADG